MKKVLVTCRLRTEHVEFIKKELGGEAEIFFDPGARNSEKIIKDVEIIYGSISRELFKKAKKLKWIHLHTAGADFVLFPELIESDVVLTCSKGIHSHYMTEFLFAMILILTKNFRAIEENRKKKIWDVKVAL